MWAASSNHDAIVRMLVEKGADVSAKSRDGFAPLLFAAREGNLDTVTFLLAHGASVNEVASDGSSPLLVATVRGHVKLAEALLDAGANPNASGAGFTALHWAAGTWPTQLSGANGIVAEAGEWSRLAGLSGASQIELVRALLAHGANPIARLTRTPPRVGFSGFALNLTGATPFLLAAMGDGTVMRVLADAGADPSVTTDGSRGTPNFTCIGGGSGACASRRTPALIVAAGFGRVTGETRVTEQGALEAVKAAVALGADVNATDEAGNTAMHAAASWGATSIVQFLADHGAKANVTNKVGETPLMFALGDARLAFTHTVYLSTADLLRKLGAHD
jgi:ankyrin repeat protein